MAFVTGKIAKRGRMFEGKFQWFGRVIKTDEAEVAGNMGGGAEDGDSVGGSTEADVPDNKFTR